MRDQTYLSWPFLDAAHRAFASSLDAWIDANVPMLEREGGGAGGPEGRAALDARCRDLVRQLGDGGWLRHVVPAAYGGAAARLDVRTLCLARERLAYRSGLADFAFAMQGLGSGPISLFGTEALRAKYLPPVARGEQLAAFALSEPHAGSDISAMRTVARVQRDTLVLDGVKTWISNAGIADWYVVFARLEDGSGARERAAAAMATTSGPQSMAGSGAGPKFVAVVVDANTPGLTVSERIDVIAPHPLGTLTFDRCTVPASQMVGAAGRGLAVALATLDVFRSTVAAAALGFARRALEEALAFSGSRLVFGKPLSEMQLTQAKLASMAMAIDTSALLIYRAAWVKDTGGEGTRVTREAAMAKLHATESAQRVIDDAVQLLGGRGLVAGATVERLYREIRALRIYEGTSEIQQLVIAGQVLADDRQASHPPPRQSQETTR
jgi:acyl-CoA dehydrogenase